MIQVKIDVLINRSPAEVFAYITNFENNPIWQNGMKECRFTTDGEFGVGIKYVQVAEFLGRRIDSHFTVLEYEPEQMVKFSSPEGTFPITITRRVDSHGAGCRVTALMRGMRRGCLS